MPRRADLPQDLSDFTGLWRLSREIRDARAAAGGRLEGTADFVPQDDRALLCREAGKLVYAGGAALEASRSYLWRADAPGRVAVSFADGRPFHRFALGASAEAWHDCAPDRYHVAYDFTRWPAWQAVWTVRGPRKDYVSISRYLRPQG